MHLNIFVSQKCFFYCKGCYSYSRQEKCNQKVDTNIIINFLKYAYEKEITNVTYCGGDPLTRSDVLTLLEKTKKIGYNISLDTLGCSIINDVISNNEIVNKKIDVKKLVKYVDKIGIPIDGSTNEIINKFRQTNLNILNNKLKYVKN